MTPKLYKHQEDWLREKGGVRRSALWWATGVGKTPIGCLWLKMRLTEGKTGLVVCPKGLTLNWQKELAVWGVEGLNEGLTVTVMSKEEFKGKTPRRVDAVIIDEADHFFAPHFKSQLAKSLRKYLNDYDPDVLLLSATPYRSSPWNIYTAATLLGHRWNYRDFEDAFFTKVRMGQRVVPVVKQSEAPRLRAAIARIGDVKTLEECADVPESVEEVIEIHQTPEQKREKQGLQDIVPIALFTAYHRIEAGGDKVERVVRLCEENKKIAIVCRYREQMAVYLAAIEKEMPSRKVYSIHGDIPTAGRQQVVERVRADDEAIILIQSQTCEGFSLESVPVMVFASMDYSYRAMVQMKGRIQRINALKKNVYLYLVCDEADKAVMASMKRKEDFNVVQFFRERTGDNR